MSEGIFDMETVLYKLGYNEKLTFLNKGRCGMWLIWIGVVKIIFGTILIKTRKIISE